VYVGVLIMVFTFGLLIGTYIGISRVWHLLKKKYPEHYYKISEEWMKR
jgi:hypothetical protein